MLDCSFLSNEATWQTFPNKAFLQCILLSSYLTEKTMRLGDAKSVKNQKRPPIILTDNRWSCTKSLRFLTKRAADWYKIGTGTRKFTFYEISSNEDTFVFCILLLNRLHRGDVARNSPVFVQQAPTTSTIPGDFLKNPPTSSNSVHESCVQFWSQPFFDGA